MLERAQKKKLSHSMDHIMMHAINIEAMTKLETSALALSLFS